MRFPAFCWFGAILFTTVLPAGEPGTAPAAAGRYAAVTVDPAHTSIYIGSVSLTMPPFTRHGGVYTSDYAAKVFPFFFFSEQGTISIEASDEQLQQLERGQAVDFKGHASNRSGAPRRVEGRAEPDAAGGGPGKIKVRVWVSKRIELIFNSVYRFSGKE